MAEAAIDRAAIRLWVERQRGVLEKAQALGTLARTKLDLKDAARAAFGIDDGAGPANFGPMLDEELEAFAADMRLATITVQQQVERKIPHTGRAIFFAIVSGFVTLVACVFADTGPGFGFTAPFIVGTVVFFIAR